MQIHSVVFALSQQINKQKVCENLFAQVKKFGKISSSKKEVSTPTPTRTSLPD